jgi:hypothetical protein
MRRQGIECIDDVFLFSGWNGAKVMPGDYQARVTIGETEETVPITLLPDPRNDATTAQYDTLESKIVEGTNLFNEIILTLDKARTARAQVQKLMTSHASSEEFKTHAIATIDQITEWEKLITQVYFQVLEDEDAWPSMLEVQVKHVVDVMDGAGAPVANGALQRLADLQSEWALLKAELAAIKSNHIEPINSWAKTNNIRYVVSP